jgi:hypothetical protein
MLMAFLCGNSHAEMTRVVQKMPSPDGRLVAIQRSTWGKDGPDYPSRCEIWCSNSRGGDTRKLHEFVLTSKELRQKVCIEEWTDDSSTIIVSFRSEPKSHMTQDYDNLLESTLWHMPVKGGARQWKHGVFKGGIIGLRGNLVCAGTDLTYGGGAGMSDWREYGTLLITDLEGAEKHRFTDASADADRGALPPKNPVASCFSQDGSFVGVLSSFQPPGIEGRVLKVWRLRDGAKRTVEKVLSFRWCADAGLLELETVEGRRRYDADNAIFIK